MNMRVLAIADAADKRLWDMLDRRLLEGVELILSRGVAEAANRVNQKPKTMQKKALQKQAEKQTKVADEVSAE